MLFGLDDGLLRAEGEQYDVYGRGDTSTTDLEFFSLFLFFSFFLSFLSIPFLYPFLFLSFFKKKKTFSFFFVFLFTFSSLFFFHCPLH